MARQHDPAQSERTQRMAACLFMQIPIQYALRWRILSVMRGVAMTKQDAAAPLQQFQTETEALRAETASTRWQVAAGVAVLGIAMPALTAAG
jgi:hypothetical protein